MSLLDRVLDALKSQVEMRGDIDRLAGSLDRLRVRLDGQDAYLLDHEKRLIRLETLVEVAQMRGTRRLPRE